MLGKEKRKKELKRRRQDKRERAAEEGERYTLVKRSKCWNGGTHSPHV